MKRRRIAIAAAASAVVLFVSWGIVGLIYRALSPPVDPTAAAAPERG